MENFSCAHTHKLQYIVRYHIFFAICFENRSFFCHIFSRAHWMAYTDMDKLQLLFYYFCFFSSSMSLLLFIIYLFIYYAINEGIIHFDIEINCGIGVNNGLSLFVAQTVRVTCFDAYNSFIYVFLYFSNRFMQFGIHLALWCARTLEWNLI